MKHKVFILMMFVVIPILEFVTGHDDGGKCNHRYLKVEETPHPVHLEHRHQVVERSAEHPMRIKVVHDESVKKLSSIQKEVFDEVVAEGVNFWERALKIRRNSGVIRLNHRCLNNRYFLLDGAVNNDDSFLPYCDTECVETKCGEVVVPKEHLQACHVCNSDGYNCKRTTESGAGVEGYDFLLYVSAIQTPQCGENIGGESKAETVAYSAHCQQESALDRPIAGHTNICPLAILTKEKKKMVTLTSTLKHELLHSLGFSLSLFAYYRDEKGNPWTPRGLDGKPAINKRLNVRRWSSKVVKRVKRKWVVRGGTVDRYVNLVVTPRVKEEVRAHFGCPSLQGAELEDQGGDGTALTHWEKRIFQNEAMTGTVHTMNPPYSRLTFALLEDSGWYIPNYDLAENITWGAGAGCIFATKSCKELMDTKSNPNDVTSVDEIDRRFPFCSELKTSDQVTRCNHDRSAVGTCNLVQYQKNLPRIYQNFDSYKGVPDEDTGKLGGSVALADFCPYVQEFRWKLPNMNGSRGTRCTTKANQPPNDETISNYALETYGDKSKCFEQGGPWQQQSCFFMKKWQRYGAGCYEFTCKGGKVGIVVAIGKKQEVVTCDGPGQNLSISLAYKDSLYTGSIICPDCHEICGRESCQNEEVQGFMDPKEGDVLKKQKVAINDNLKCNIYNFVYLKQI